MSQGLQEVALQILCKIPLDVPSPSSYISLFTACSKSRALTTARLLHTHLSLLGISLSPVVGQHLVVALAKCGAVDDAVHVSWSLSHRTVISWTAIISALAGSACGTEALEAYHCMLEDGIQPDHYTFVSLFKACGSIRDLPQARAVHADARQYGLVQDIYMVSTLIGMYSKCGSIVEAENVFDASKEHDLVTWNSMLAAYAEHGENEKALQCYLAMEEAGCSPNDRTYVSALQVCAMIAGGGEVLNLNGAENEKTPLQLGQVLHTNAEKKGFTHNVFLGNSLVNMYGKCGVIGDAKYVFATLQERTTVSWNSILSAYVSQGQATEAFGIYLAMVSHVVRLDHLTYVSAFQACAILVEKEEGFQVKGDSIKLAAFTVGQALHSKAHKKDLMPFAIVSNTLISLYGKCGAVAEAEHVFATMLQRNEVSYNAMLSTYNEQGQGENALMLYAQMELEGVSPDESTFVQTLQACVLLMEKEGFPVEVEKLDGSGPFDIGHALHAEVLLRGFTADCFIASTLVSMYGKCGGITEAEYVFRDKVNGTLVIWNAMISSYVTRGQEFSALRLYRQMHEEGMVPDQLTYATVILACATLMENEYASFQQQQKKVLSLDIGRALHADVKHRCRIFNAYVGNSLMSLYDKHGCHGEIDHAFGVVTQRDTVSWNAMLSAYVDRGMESKSLQLFVQMLKENITTDQQTVVIALQACVGISSKQFVQGESLKVIPLGIACAIHEYAKKEGYAGNAMVGSALVSTYSKLGAIGEVEVVFREIRDRSVATWTAVISAHVDHGEGLEALHLYQKMQEHCVAPNHITITCILQACTEIGNFESCERLHFDIIAAGYDQMLSVSATLLDAYGTQRSMLDVQVLFDKLPDADMVSWNACIGGHAGSGDCLASLRMLEHLKCTGLEPDKFSLTSVLAACSHSGLVAEGLHYMISSRQDYNTVEDLKQFASILDLLGRAGDFKRANDVLQKMPLKQADQETLLSLLGACQAHRNAEMAKHTFDIAMDVEHTQATAYVLMSNIYADAAAQEHESNAFMSG